MVTLSRDPLLRHAVQPLVDALHLRPRSAAGVAANLFVAMTVTLAAVRVATLDTVTRPDLYLSQTQGVIGAAIGYGCLRFCIVNGERTLIGLPGMVHLCARLMYLALLVIDVREIHLLVTTDLPVTAMSLMRSSMQLTQTTAFLASLYLSVSRDPPPPRRHPRRVAVPAI